MTITDTARGGTGQHVVRALPVSSGGVALSRGQEVQVTSRLQTLPMRALDLVVASPASWRVLFDNCSWLGCAGEIPPGALRSAYGLRLAHQDRIALGIARRSVEVRAVYTRGAATGRESARSLRISALTTRIARPL